MSGYDIAREVAAAIAEAGAEVGDGTPLTATLIQASDEASGPEWDPQPGEPTLHTITVLDSYKTLRAPDGSPLGTREHLLKMAATPDGPTPSITDEVELNGIKYAVANVTPTAPGGVVIMWELTLDR